MIGRYFYILALPVVLSACSAPDQSAGNRKTPPEVLAGGATTVFDTSANAFSLPAANLSVSRRDGFFIGNSFFRNPWVIAPSSTSARDGLGPLFNTNTCQSCHVKDGRGRPPLRDEAFASALVRFSVPPASKEDFALLQRNGVIPEPVYGGQLNSLGIPGVAGEANPVLHYEYISGRFTDGTLYELRRPVLSMQQLGYGPMHPQTMTSLRTAPAMIGLGLLEAIAEKDIQALSDPDDTNGDGLSGRPNRVWDIVRQQPVLGRFGWKAGQPTVQQQAAAAFNGDIGITSSLFPQPSCTESQTDCRAAPSGGQPEISDEILDFVTFYAKTLAVPARRNTEQPQVRRGEQVFHAAGCASCHVPQHVTGVMPDFPELSGQRIYPYTDLLLHDMGEGLSDGRPEFLADGNEWRTPPLWGVGLIQTVNEHTLFLHDGRARNLMEAVLWHGGEAENAKQKVLQLNAQEREDFLAFLNSL